MNTIANNIANVNTSGFRKQGAIFSEYVVQAGSKDFSDTSLQSSVSIGRLGAHYNDFTNASLKQTGGTYDLAIEGEGFFLIGTEDGPRLSRAGRFMTDREGALITADGDRVLDDSASPIIIPPDAVRVAIGGDGSISANGQPLGKIGVVIASHQNMQRIGNNLWHADSYSAVANPRILQGFLEGSNVNPVIEIARMIEVGRAYEAGQKLLEIEDERLAKTIRSIGSPT